MSCSISGVPRSTDMTARVKFETTLFLLILSRATPMPRGSENSSVRKNIAQVPPMPSSIRFIIVVSFIDVFLLTHTFPKVHAPSGDVLFMPV